MLNRVDECRRNAAQILADDELRGAYLDLARRWRKMAHQAQQKSNTDAALSSRANAAQALPHNRWQQLAYIALARLLPDYAFLANNHHDPK